ncbi:MAG TPA: hypothetical protein DCM19_01295 [Parasutterella excrementihominis]|nr:hypothetical protein [Parasutterella excrementihominis]HBZ28967.1 hypothetical protein [Parasutterella excrementihominis]
MSFVFSLYVSIINEADIENATEKDKKRGGSQKTLAQNFSPQLLFVDKELRKNSMLQRRRLIQSIDK